MNTKKKELTEYEYKCIEDFYYPKENKNEQEVTNEEEKYIKNLCQYYLKYLKSDVEIISFGNLNQDDKVTWESVILLKNISKYVNIPIIPYINRGQDFENQYRYTRYQS